jgi:hypothetical protein
MTLSGSAVAFSELGQLSQKLAELVERIEAGEERWLSLSERAGLP